MDREELKNNVFVGVVEDNQDPKRIGRVKVRVMNVFDEIPKDDIPWSTPHRDLSGNEFSIPDIGKVVSVIFDQGIPYKPEYIYSEHYNINLENKLKNISSDDYTSFKSPLFDHSTQIYRTNSEGLKIDHEYSNINITKDGNINHNLRDNNSKTNIGSPDASQSAILGNHFMDWMDKFVEELLGSGGGPYLGNLGSPVVCAPGFINVLLEYKASRDPKFLSKHVWIVDNDEVKAQKREYINQKGDTWKSTVSNNNLTTVEGSSYNPEDRPETGRAEVFGNVPGDIQQATSAEQEKTVYVSNYKNGQVPLNKMIKNKFLSKNLGGDAAYLMVEASNALDQLMTAYNSANFKGKQEIIFTDGYRSLERQKALYAKYGSGRAAQPGTSNHGWGIAIDIYWGVRTSMYKDNSKRPSAFKHPVYQWFFQNAHNYGWYNPAKLRDDSATDEWWHWEYHGKKGPNQILSQRYIGQFTSTDINNIKSTGGTYRA